jgi:hypothetical protein
MKAFWLYRKGQEFFIFIYFLNRNDLISLTIVRNYYYRALYDAEDGEELVDAFHLLSSKDADKYAILSFCSLHPLTG